MKLSHMPHNMNELQKHYTMWKKPDRRGHLQNDFIYMKHPEYVIP